MTLYGSGFANTPDITCRFSGVADVSGRWISPSTVVCLSPETVSTGNVSVEFSYNDEDFSNNSVQYRYSSPAVALNLLPSYGPIVGGNIISVIGLNYEESSEFTCLFKTGNTQTTAPGLVMNVSVALCFSPALSPNLLSQSSMLTVSNNGVDIDLYLEYIYYDQMHVKSIMPSSGPSHGATSVLVIGSGYATGLRNIIHGFTCTFGQITVPASIQSSTSLLCISPASNPGPSNLIISLEGLLIADAALYFEYYGEATRIHT